VVSGVAEAGEEKRGAAATLASLAAGAGLALSLAAAQPALADGLGFTKLPPLDSDPNRCERGYDGNTIGQSNGVVDRVLDLRQCSYEDKNLDDKTLSGAIMSDASFKGASMKSVIASKAYAQSSNFDGVDFSSAVLDRCDFSNASFRGAIFFNAVITGASFENADMTGADFESSTIGQEDVKRLCTNPTVVDETRFSLGCRD